MAKAAFLLAGGQLEPGAFVLHDCDVSLCINPRHLRQGSQIENLNDPHRRKRHSAYQGLNPCERVHRTLEERLERQQRLRNTE